MLASAGGDSLTALYPAVAAIVVAAIGFAGNIILDRRRSRNPPDDDDTNVISALASALAAETEARKAAEQRALECEAREKAKRR